MFIDNILPKSSKRIKELETELQESQDRVSLLDKEVLDLKERLKEKEEIQSTGFMRQQLKKIEALEEEVLKQKQRIQETKSIAQDATQVKYDFLSNIRHEIRTPMNSILAFADMLIHDLQDKTRQSYAKNIFASGHKLLGLLDNIIELSKLESGSFEIKEKAVDIHLLFNLIVNEQKAFAFNKGLELTLEIDEKLPNSLIVDDARIKEILINLIDNAVKFTQKGYIKVRVVVDKYDKVQHTLDFSIVVTDSGMGIDAVNHQKIFEIFEKRENANEVEFQGTGLGLSINRKVARIMNGDITVNSRLAIGSTFTFSLRGVEIVLSNDEVQEDSVKVDFSLIRPSGANIMVVDDTDESREIIKNAFINSSVKVFTYDHPRQAIESLGVTKYDLIFIDINILSIDDNAVSKVISKMSKAPLVTLTSISLKNIDFMTGGANVVGHLKKPLSKVELFKIAIKILNTSNEIQNGVETTLENTNEFSNMKREEIKEFLQLHSKGVAKLFLKAVATNDLNSIKIFAVELATLAKKYNITPLVSYAQTLIENIDNFDIEAINSMMGEYKTKIKRLKSI